MKNNYTAAHPGETSDFKLSFNEVRRLHTNPRVHALAVLLASTFCATEVQAQTVTPNLVSACSGVSLPPSVVTGILAPVVDGIVAPTEGTVNSLLGIVTPLHIDTATLLGNAAAGAPITLQLLNQAGTVVGPADRCDLRADSFGLNTQGGVAIGGNRITGLGTNGLDASAGEATSIAFGNSAVTDATATGAIAFGTRASVSAGAVGGTALGTGAQVMAANGVALGAGSMAARGALASYGALGLIASQTSAGEVSVGTPGAERQITNVAAGSAPTDAVNVAQLAGVATQIGTLTGNAVLYDDVSRTRVSLGGVGTGVAPVVLGNVAAGTVAAGSTEAVNGGQLFATNAAITANTTAITNLTNNVANGGTGPVRYSNPGSSTTPNGGTPTNDLTLVGATAAPVALHNVASGAIAAGSTDAVNGGQIFGLALTAVNAVAYDTDAAGARTNTVTLQGGNSAAPVKVTNVAAGMVAAGSTDAVNGGQLQAINQAVVAAQTTAGTALTLGQNSVQYDNPRRSDITLGSGVGGAAGAAVALHNVAAGTSATDAVNVTQLGSGLSNAIGQANAYTDQRLATVSFDLRRVRRESSAGTAGALAAAGLPQAYQAGRGMIAFAGGTYRGQSAFALGLSKAMDDGHTVVKMSGTFDTQNRVGGAAGVGYQF